MTKSKILELYKIGKSHLEIANMYQESNGCSHEKSQKEVIRAILTANKRTEDNR
jgi:hypothetical protein